MTALKSLPAPPARLALSDASKPSRIDFVSAEILDSIYEDLVQLIEELRANKTESYTVELDNKIDWSTFPAQIEANNRALQKILQEMSPHRSTFWKDCVEGASLAFNAFPVRKHRFEKADFDALRGDWIVVCSDVGRTWRTVETLLSKPVKFDDRNASAAERPK